ncbi:bile acid:sodium symporter [Streptomyces sp. K1PN6]|uniref:Bile acid:sodium symporter n=1 Tax=Streptomyces acidicola TaxID=2596892 RepID=A0A5N8WMQ8_9ACTN|nr:bile acid:sodium symporter [Streptomyces acidicola]
MCRSGCGRRESAGWRTRSRCIGPFISRHKRVLGPLDRCLILLVVYTAFSRGMTEGIWHQITPLRLHALLSPAAALLGLALAATSYTARRLSSPSSRIRFPNRPWARNTAIQPAGVQEAGNCRVVTVLTAVECQRLDAVPDGVNEVLPR